MVKLINTKDYLLLIDKQAEIKEGDILYSEVHKYTYKVKSIERNRLVWHEGSHKIIAYYPLSKEAKELDLPLLPNPLKDNMFSLLDKDIPSCWSNYGKRDGTMSELEDLNKGHRDSWIKGYKAAQSDKQFSLEDIISIAQIAYNMGGNAYKYYHGEDDFIKSIQEDIELLNTQQLPKEFIPEYWCTNTTFQEDMNCPCFSLADNDCKFKIITNQQGKQQLIGEYEY